MRLALHMYRMLRELYCEVRSKEAKALIVEYATEYEEMLEAHGIDLVEEGWSMSLAKADQELKNEMPES